MKFWIRDERYNGKAYYRLDGQRLLGLPDDPLDLPRKDLLRWRNEERFSG